MQEEKFKNWLSTERKLSLKTVQNRISNCRKVENYYSDLNKKYDLDKFSEILSDLTYSVDDEKINKQPNSKIIIKGNLREGFATLKQSVNLYKEFRIY